MGAAKPEDQPKQSCCLGLLYYSTALQNKGRRPVCLGIPHKPGSQVQLEGRSQVTDGYTDFKFMCIGYAVFEHQRRAAQAAGTHDMLPPPPPKLPYCEGIEAVMAVPTESSEAAAAVSSSNAADADLAAATAATATATQPAPWRPAAQEQQQQRRQSLLGGLASTLRGSDDGENQLAKFAEKFNKVAQRNLDRMKVNFSTAGGALKSLMDRDSDD